MSCIQVPHLHKVYQKQILHLAFVMFIIFIIYICIAYCCINIIEIHYLRDLLWKNPLSLLSADMMFSFMNIFI